MTDYDDLVRRLREASTGSRKGDLCREAADAIESLRAELDEARKACPVCETPIERQ